MKWVELLTEASLSIVSGAFGMIMIVEDAYVAMSPASLFRYWTSITSGYYKNVIEHSLFSYFGYVLPDVHLLLWLL